MVLVGDGGRLEKVGPWTCLQSLALSLSASWLQWVSSIMPSAMLFLHWSQIIDETMNQINP